jgi:hypothetical protein
MCEAAVEPIVTAGGLRKVLTEPTNQTLYKRCARGSGR